MNVALETKTYAELREIAKNPKETAVNRLDAIDLLLKLGTKFPAALGVTAELE